jgi:hypothetical protein
MDIKNLVDNNEVAWPVKRGAKHSRSEFRRRPPSWLSGKRQSFSPFAQQFSRCCLAGTLRHCMNHPGEAGGTDFRGKPPNRLGPRQQRVQVRLYRVAARAVSIVMRAQASRWRIDFAQRQAA